MKWSSAMLNFFPLLVFGYKIIFPQHEMQLPNYLPRDSILYTITFIIYAPTAMYSLLYCTNVVKFLIQIFSAYMILIVPLLRDELCLFAKIPARQYRCSNELRQLPQNLGHAYRSLQLLDKLLSLTTGPLLPLMHSIFGHLAISAGYQIIMAGVGGDSKRTALFLAMFGMVVVWISVISVAAKLQKESVKCILSWKTGVQIHWRSGKDRKYMAKFRKSCKPLYIGYLGYLRITPMTVLKFVQGVVRGTFRSVLAMRKSS
ncbi:hypothetical protein Fcan01_00673 [Folsomia candida]|uniref:Uncharacterized protein n=1 Tax=Folsomia candida TaxID=158441 RepID=A0A226F6L3_FOLCA|nr:hypothetical protein Fcan01_00673 [Folsomia candida]